jgi:hypothetical protein
LQVQLGHESNFGVITTHLRSDAAATIKQKTKGNRDEEEADYLAKMKLR